MSCVERLYTKKTFTRADLHMISRYRTHGKGRRLRSLCDRRRRLRSYREECFESTSVRSDCGTCSRTTVQTQLAACGDWKNAGQKERETLSGWLADQAARRSAVSRVSPHLVHDLPIEVIQFGDDRSQTLSSSMSSRLARPGCGAGGRV